jgi:Mrp family chromosome partitioning ATPase
VANAFAAAFIASRKLREQGQLRLAEAVVTTKLRASSKTSPDYAILGQQLRDLQIAEATVTGDYYVLAAATPPESPSSPRPRRDAAAALALSLFTGIVLAFMFEQFNTRLRSHREVAEALRLPVVGRIPRISRRSLRSGALVAIHEPDSPAAESFRVLRNNMDYLSVDDDVSTILVTSCTSGDGKSVTVSNLALTLAMGGLKVVAVDADLRRPRLHEYFDLPNTQGLSTLVAGKAELANVLQPVVLPLPAPRTGSGDSGTDEPDEKARRSKLYVLTSGPLPPNPGEILASRRFGAILHELGNSTVDIVLVDSPDCMSVGDAAAIAAKVDGTFMLVSMSSITRPVLADAGEFLERLPCRKLGIIAVRDTTLRTSQYGYHSEKKRAVLV